MQHQEPSILHLCQLYVSHKSLLPKSVFTISGLGMSNLIYTLKPEPWLQCCGVTVTHSLRHLLSKATLTLQLDLLPLPAKVAEFRARGFH